jgi:deazaflavin-dependent oxidoreductase (nitroreductase family)
MANDVSKLRREDVQEIPGWVVPGLKRFMHVMTRAHVWLYRVSQGRLGKNFAGAPCCFVGMTGRKSGLRREIPLIYIPHGDEVILVGSQGGLERDPDWVRNMKANPAVEVMAEGKTRKMLARLANDVEKAERWPTAVAVYPDFDQYQARTERDIPVFICTPA